MISLKHLNTWQLLRFTLRREVFFSGAIPSCVSWIPTQYSGPWKIRTDTKQPQALPWLAFQAEQLYPHLKDRNCQDVPTDFQHLWASPCDCPSLLFYFLFYFSFVSLGKK